MRACCVRSAWTAPRPISTPTCQRTTIFISKTTTSSWTSRIRIWCSKKCLKYLRATRSRGSTWSCACARSAERLSLSTKLCRHARACRGHPRLDFFLASKDVDGWDKRGHDKVFTSMLMAASIHLLIGVDAPQPLLFDPAVKTIAGDMAPGGSAMFDLGHDANLKAGADRAGRIGPLVKRGEVVLVFHRNHRGAATGEQRVIDPTFRPFRIAN